MACIFDEYSQKSESVDAKVGITFRDVFMRNTVAITLISVSVISKTKKGTL